MIPEYGGNLYNIKGLENRVTVNISDVRDIYSMEVLVRGQDFLFNLAGQTSHLDSMSDPYTDLEINCRSQLSILEACRPINPEVKVILASTRQIYGIPRYLPVDENTCSIRWMSMELIKWQENGTILCTIMFMASGPCPTTHEYLWSLYAGQGRPTNLFRDLAAPNY